MELTVNYAKKELKDISNALKDLFISKDKIFTTATESFYVDEFQKAKFPIYAILKALENLKSRFMYSIQWSEIADEIESCMEHEPVPKPQPKWHITDSERENTRKMFEALNKKYGIPPNKPLFSHFTKLEKVEGTKFYSPTSQPFLKHIAEDMQYWNEHGTLQPLPVKNDTTYEDTDIIEERNDSLFSGEVS